MKQLINDINLVAYCGLYCGACGISLVDAPGSNCGCSARRNWLERLACGVCGRPASMSFVHGARCPGHEFVVEPSAAIIADGVVFTLAIGRE